MVKRCAHCRTRIDVGIRCLVKRRRREEIHFFCNRQCRNAWREGVGEVLRSQVWRASGYRCRCGCGQTNLKYDDFEYSWERYAPTCWEGLPRVIALWYCECGEMLDHRARSPKSKCKVCQDKANLEVVHIRRAELKIQQRNQETLRVLRQQMVSNA